MKRLVTNIFQCIVLVCLLCWLAFFCGLILPSTVVGKTSVADEIISLDVTDQPLGEVLESISIAVGCQFNVDESWEDYPITASFNNEPLYRGLKHIFRNINNAVIYGADRTIRIIIYDEGTPSGKAIENSVTIKSSQEPIQQSQPFSEATAPQPEVEISEDSESGENGEQQLEESAEPVSEANEAGAENMEAPGEESSETATEMKSAALEPIQHENGPEGESNRSEEAESDLDSPENSERMENSEESNMN